MATPDTSTPALELAAVGLRFGGVDALSDVDLSVGRGELVGLIGPNGAGKSSLLNVMTGVYRPTSGVVSLLGRHIYGGGGRHGTSLRPHQVARLGLGRSFQNLSMFDHLTVFENVMCGLAAERRSMHPAALWAVGRHRSQELADAATVDELLAQLELDRWRDRPAGSLPYGLQKRVDLARAAVRRPPVLLLDEPAAGLSHQATVELATFVVDIWRSYAPTIVMVEHNMQLVMQLVDRVVVLDRGRPIFDGTPATAATDPAVVDAYLGVSR